MKIEEAENLLNMIRSREENTDMARLAGKTVSGDGGVAVAEETAVGSELYESLSEDRQEAYDAIVRMGYRPNKGTGGLWFATMMNDATAAPIGPSEDVLALAEMIAELMDESSVKLKEVVLAADEDGNTFLPGAEEILEEVDIPELRKPALDYHAYKTDRISALAREVEAKEILDFLMHKHQDKLPTDKETGNKFFKAGSPDGIGRAVVIDLVKGDKIKSRVVDEGGE